MFIFIKVIVFILMVVISVAFFTLVERKVLSIFMNRVGPNKVGFLGVFQPVSDAFKLMNKGTNHLFNFSPFYYYASSFLTIFLSVSLWLCFSGFSYLFEFKFSLLLILFVMSVGTLNLVYLGWSSFSKYPLIGSLRSVSLLISYESLIFLCLFFFILFYRSLSFSIFGYDFLGFLFILSPWLMFFWIPSILAEMNRTPFDFSEGESELVSGFNTDFGSMGFTMIFLSEYMNIILFSFVSAFLFFTSLSLIFSVLFMFLILWFRAVLPRYRYDLLMNDAWWFLLPFITWFLILSLFILS